MKTEVNHLGAEIGVSTPRIRKSDDLEVHVVFTNRSDNEVVLNTLFLDFGTILLKVRRSDTTPVPLGPPPMPPVDDGKTGRITLKPGRSATFKYRGVNLFGSGLPPGTYQVKFHYENEDTANTDNREWKGIIESDWLSFDVTKDSTADKQSSGKV